MALLVIVALLPASAGRALEAFEGRVQLHGFFDSQFRTISANFGEDWDVTQWYNILNLELELDLLPEGWGPINSMSGYVRLEVRFDCIYSRGCGMLRGVNAYGDRSKSLPRRLSSGEYVERVSGNKIVEPTITRISGGSTDPTPLDAINGFRSLAASTGADGFDAEDPCDESLMVDSCTFLAQGEEFILKFSDPRLAYTGLNADSQDQPFPPLFTSFDDFRWTSINSRGGGSSGLAVSTLGPWLPKNFFEANATLADVPNPFDRGATSSLLSTSAYNGVVRNTWDTWFETALGQNPDVDRAQLIARLRVAQATRIGDPDDPNDDGPALVEATRATEPLYPVQGYALPFRPIALADAGDPGWSEGPARGIYYPSMALRNELATGRINDGNEYNIDETDRAWNRGQSQDENELKEAYLDVEFLDHRLWMRIGKQTIVWGKTELFSAMDQFNPRDLALQSLPSLEESRIALWSVRSVYSLYDVGPFQDVRLEVAFNYDDFQGVDIGACGEPYAPNITCTLSGGMLAHGQVGAGLAGIDRPPSPWTSLEGWEVGGRIEFRYGRASFAISDWWGYGDFPYIDAIGYFERNVDPVSGRPRIQGSRNPCPIVGDAIDCLQAGPTDRRLDLLVTDANGDPTGATEPNQWYDAFLGDPDDPGYNPRNALEYAAVNPQLFAVVCASSIGFGRAVGDPTGCGQVVFNTTTPIPDNEGQGNITQLFSSTLAGSLTAANSLAGNTKPGLLAPWVGLTNQGGGRDLLNLYGCRDRRSTSVLNPGSPGVLCGARGSGSFLLGKTLGVTLTPEQEALIGCGPFFGTNCDDSGIDLLNVDASALFQSFAGFDGMTVDRTDIAGQQPGTLPWALAQKKLPAVCTTTDLGGPAGAAGTLPGCRRKWNDVAMTELNPYWDPDYDGDPDTVLTVNNLSGQGTSPDGTPYQGARLPGHPLTGDPWVSEMAALSWNYMVFVVTTASDFDADDPYNGDGDKCSYVTPQVCEGISTLFGLAGQKSRDVRAGGNGEYGRHTFVWQSGGEAVLRYQKRNVLGFAMDFADDFTKSNFNFEFTWLNDVIYGDADSDIGRSDADQFNFTLSVDRPTFVNFLNSGRSIFINSQWFVQYISGYRPSFNSNGPWNVLGTLAFSTGYFQDRLLPSLALVYDVQSNSGAALPSITYRITSNFRVSLGVSLFKGHIELRPMPLRGLPPTSNQLGSDAYKVGVENGVAPLRNRDELWLRLSYSF